ncbi:membrane protein, partial [methanotrophic bacterial endosymbiont of Bathymodiolus sp.]
MEKIMKSRTVIFITVCSILLSSNIQAGNIDQDLQINSNETIIVAQENPPANVVNPEVPFPSIDFVILLAIGVFFARKHQTLAKKQLNLLKKNKNNPNSIAENPG